MPQSGCELIKQTCSFWFSSFGSPCTIRNTIKYPFQGALWLLNKNHLCQTSKSDVPVSSAPSLTSFTYPAMRPQSTAWAITAGELLDYLWNKFPAALEQAGRGGAHKILRNTELPLEQTRGRAGRWSDCVCSATSTAFARQKKASGATESPQQSSRWTQTWADFLSLCRSGKLKGKEKAQGAGDASFLFFLVAGY